MLRESHILLFSIFIAGLCSIVYELLIATTGAYFLGDSITQFSLTIGVYMAFMGVGSYFSRFVKDGKLLSQFIGFELMLALIGGVSVPLLYLAYALGVSVQFTSVLLTGLIGILIGLEIPLLSRLMEKHYTLKANLSNVLSLDYFGALLATLLFPFLFLPTIGIFKTSLMFGLINLSIALSLLWYFSNEIPQKAKRPLQIALLLILTILVGLMAASKELNKAWNGHVYEDTVVFSKQTQYQQIVMTRHRDDIRLFLNGGLQFSSIDEYRYHETLVHPLMQRIDNPKNILVLGGGDGLALRELLKYESVNTITLVDLDPAIADLAKRNHYLLSLNQKALLSEKVTVIHDDAMKFLDETKLRYDAIVVDLPDPKTVSLARLYSLQFYRLVKSKLSPEGVMMTQATSPFFAKDAFWAIYNSLEASGFERIKPFVINIPSFGEWGFVLACKSQCEVNENQVLVETKIYSQQLDETMSRVTKDLARSTKAISTLDKPNVLYFYLEGWRYWN